MHPPPQFFVYVIESNRQSEVSAGLNEGAALAKALTFASIPCKPFTIKNRQVLSVALGFGTDFQMWQFPGCTPVLHFSGHGDEAGVALTSGEVVNWRELSGMLMPFQQKTAGRFLLAMSCCKGAYAARGLIDAGLRCFGVVGSSEIVEWSDNVVAFISFYHNLAKGRNIEEAVEAMKMAAGNHTYQLVRCGVGNAASSPNKE